MSNQHAEYTLTLEHLWQFSLQFYGVREVKEACLSLQNNYHGNVNLLLLLRWLDEQQLIFQEKDWPLVQSCLGRSETLLHSFRDLRRPCALRLDSRKPSVAPLTTHLRPTLINRARNIIGPQPHVNYLQKSD